MKIIVTTEFVDIHTGMLHPVGEELTVSKARYAEILRAGSFVRPAAQRNGKKGAVPDGNGNSRPDGR